jgi:hypothetical protein
MICSEMPWLEARGDLPRDESCHGIISQESMKNIILVVFSLNNISEGRFPTG